MFKVIFERLSKEETIDIIKWTLFDREDGLALRDNTLIMYPELVKIDINKKDDIASLKFIEEIVSKYYDSLIDDIDLSIEKYNNIWNKYNDEYLNRICNYLNVEVDKNIKIVSAKVGYIPVSPRYLDDYSFCTNLYLLDKNVLEVTMHELLHFIWFIKWKEIYPMSNRKEWECPYLPWKYSEMVVDPILNSEEIMKMFDCKLNCLSYNYFYDIIYDNEKVMEHLISIFNQDISIEDKIKNGYEYIVLALNK